MAEKEISKMNKKPNNLINSLCSKSVYQQMGCCKRFQDGELPWPNCSNLYF